MGKASPRDGGGREPAGIRHPGGRQAVSPLSAIAAARIAGAQIRSSNKKNVPRCGFSYPRVNLERF
jgi:hypothetical protein